MILHAGLIARRVDGLWLGALIDGPSGAGKSDLALRAARQGFRLVADDRVVAFLSGGRLYGRAPDTLAGLIEVRGVGVVRHDCLPFARIVLSASCAPGPDAVERVPDDATTTILGVRLPTLAIWPLEAAAPAKLAVALERLGGRAQQRYQAASRHAAGARGPKDPPLRHRE
jgi:serine kinase of HPr protein (carbohydrate metabolism regulator)